MPDFTDVVDGLLHAETQIDERGVDLTAAAVHEVAAPGRVDFGGDELAEAAFEPCELTRREPDDDYQWWHLDAGQYVVQYNEFFTGDEPMHLQARNKLLARGASHPSLRVDDHLPLVPLSVGGAGIKLKENARISTLRPLQVDVDAHPTEDQHADDQYAEEQYADDQYADDQ
jgi:hypothetical protein